MYSQTEITSIYELGRLLIESGFLRRAELIVQGLTEVAPEFSPAWLALTYLQIAARDNESAVQSARNALKADQDSVEAMLFLVTSLFMTGDYNAAGTILGEVRDRIESGSVRDPQIIRLYKAQLARFETRER